MEITNSIIDAIKNSATVLVCGHVRPDGDCVSSAIAVKLLCEKLGKKADAVCDDDCPYFLGFLPDCDNFGKPRFEYYDLFISVDCATESRLGKYRQNLYDAANSIVIDHHPTNEGYGKINHIVPDACSTCAVIFNIFEKSGLIDETVATLLYAGLSTDTGHFMHANTNAEVFDIASKLSGYGLDIGKINHALYCNKKIERIKLVSVALSGIRLYENGAIGLLSVSLDDLKKCGCRAEDTEGLIDYASSISGVRISVAVCEKSSGLFRVSLRSVDADVSAVASEFGGGGHKLASGCILSGTLKTVEKRIVAAAAAALKK